MPRWLRNTLLTSGAVFLLLALLVVGMLWSLNRERRTTDRLAGQFFADMMPVLSSWDVDKFLTFVADEAEETFDGESYRQAFEVFRELGSLQHFEEPAFAGIVRVRSNPYGYIVDYRLDAEFSNSTADVKVRVVRENGQLKVWGLSIHTPDFFDLIDKRGRRRAVAP